MKKGNLISKKLDEKALQAQTKKIEAFEKKKNIDYEAYFEGWNPSDFEISDDDLRKDLEIFVPKPVVRTLNELKEEANKKIKEAMKTIKMGYTNRDDFFLDSNTEMEKFQGEIDKNNIKKSLFEFAFICGNYNNARKWIRLDNGIYFCLPLLLEKGNHAALVTFFSEKIAAKLERGIENAITNVLKKKGMQILTPRFCFSKGHLICADDQRVNVLNDLKLIFVQMSKPQNDRDFTGIKVIAKKPG